MLILFTAELQIRQDGAATHPIYPIFRIINAYTLHCRNEVRRSQLQIRQNIPQMWYCRQEAGQVSLHPDLTGKTGASPSPSATVEGAFHNETIFSYDKF